MLHRLTLLAATALTLAAAPALAADKPESPAPGPNSIFKEAQVPSSGTVTVKGQKIDYQAISGTIVVHPEHWDDAAWRQTTGKDDKAEPAAEASMFYVAYFKKGAPAADRPITFLFNGGPGSATVWLHLGAFGPKRVLTGNGQRAPAAPYRLVEGRSRQMAAPSSPYRRVSDR
jgi:carboxypeptidase C (cathepsin A)